MKIIEIMPLENGAHRNQDCDSKSIPEGYAVIPDGIETPNFPFGDITVDEIDGVSTVTSWIPGITPEPPTDSSREPTTDDILNTLLGVTE